ncbi:ATP synthase subunit I [Paenibacillus sp. S-38]|uniref:ATP synthase subunit I n=1 Tax=Paenibacillus sp. S-38 TaxID=3416710 RepID=UPI003CF5B938
MDDFSAHLKTVQNTFLFFLSFCLVGWALLEGYRPYFAGLMLGATVSIINARYLAWKIRRVTGSEGDGPPPARKANMGFMTRAAIATMAGLLANRYPEFVSLPTTVAGYFFTQLVTLVLGFISIRKANK